MISGYYREKSILITGTTGFVGKVILEKILRTFPNIKAIYISIKVS
jgi:fatty acyl-CoA reductase